MLTFPIIWDQVPTGQNIVEEWKIGWRVNREAGWQNLVTGAGIAGLQIRFMTLESEEGTKMRKRAKELQQMCRITLAEGGSSYSNLDTSVSYISQR